MDEVEEEEGVDEEAEEPQRLGTGSAPSPSSSARSRG